MIEKSLYISKKQKKEMFLLYSPSKVFDVFRANHQRVDKDSHPNFKKSSKVWKRIFQSSNLFKTPLDLTDIYGIIKT